MRLFFHPLSSNARRALLVARHLGLDIELVSVALESGAQKSPAYLALNPNGRVPLLVDGDFVLWESHAIMQYLADTTGGQDIYPAGAKARADVNRWLFWSACHFAPACALFIRERVSKVIVAGAGAPGPAPTDYVPGTDIDTRMADVIAEHLPSLPAPDDVYPSDSHTAGPLPDADFARAEDWQATYTLDGSELLVIASAPSEGGVACAGCAKQQVPGGTLYRQTFTSGGPDHWYFGVSFERPDGSAVSVYESLDAPDEQTGQERRRLTGTDAAALVQDPRLVFTGP